MIISSRDSIGFLRFRILVSKKKYIDGCKNAFILILLKGQKNRFPDAAIRGCIYTTQNRNMSKTFTDGLNEIISVAVVLHKHIHYYLILCLISDQKGYCSALLYLN